MDLFYVAKINNFHQPILGGDDKSVESMQSQIESEKKLSEIPASQRRAVPKELSYYAKKHKVRNEAIISAYESGG